MDLLIERLLGKPEAARYRRQAEAVDRFRTKFLGAEPPPLVGFSGAAWAANIGGAASATRRPAAARGESLARLLDRINPLILDVLSPELGEIAAEVVVAALARERSGA